MAYVRISGLVRAAKRAHDRLQAGLEPADRPAFLEGVARTIAKAEAICREARTPPADLPAPSRRALADLRRIASLEANALPVPRPDAAPPTLRISNVIATLDRALDDLARPALDVLDPATEPGKAPEHAAVAEARSCVETVRRICADDHVTPAALPRRTGEAYAFLAWLLDPGHVRLYQTQRDAVIDALRSTPTSSLRKPGVVPPVRFRPGSRIWAVRREGADVQCTLHVGWLAATEDAFQDLAVMVHAHKAAPAAVLQRYRTFLDSPAFGAIQHDLDALRGVRAHAPRGRVRDLEAIFERLDARFFGGRLERPDLRWQANASQARFGHYVPALDRIVLDARLDDERVPEFVTGFVLYHELLHKVHGAMLGGRRRRVHTPAFQADERRYPRWREAEAWLGALARGEGGPRPTATPPTQRSPPERSPLERPIHAPVRRPEPEPAGRAWTPAGIPAPPATSTPIVGSRRVPRNAPCPCGSGRKAKRCCGRGRPRGRLV
ncbi:MAG: SEC-C metal-binding domain-containing protein [Planctomycetota bacterium]